jgi:sulfonate transport system substrate-binding protein
MRNIIVYITAVLLVISCKTSNQKHEVPKLKTIRIGYIMNHVPLVLGKELNWFKNEFDKDSIKIEYHLFEVGPPLIEAFAANRLDIGTVGDQPAIVGWSNGIKIKAVGNFAAGYKLAGLAVRENSGIKKLSDLKGKKVATAIGSVYQHLLNLYLTKAGLSLDDIQLVNLKFGESVTALASNNIDAVVIGEPFLSQIEYKKIGKVIAYSDSLMYFSDPIVVSDTFAKTYPSVVKRLLQIYYHGNKWAQQNRDSAAEVLIKANPILPKPVVMSILSRYPDNISIDRNVIHAFEDTYHFLRNSNIVKVDKPINNFYDTTFLHEAGLQ